MVSMTGLMQELDELTIARRVGIHHDEARNRFPVRSNTVGTFDEFARIIGDYVMHHVSSCVCPGGTLPRAEARGKAKAILERQYRRRQGDMVTAFNDAHDGTNSGLRGILDVIAEGLKAESVEYYIRDALERHVSPNDWESKVEAIRQLLRRYGADLSPTIRVDQPERYAANHTELIRGMVDSLQRTSTIFRRL